MITKVGSGSAGSYVASQLSEFEREGERLKILLIEAGPIGKSDFLLNIPVSQPLILRSDYDWKYVIEPQTKACLAFEGDKCNWSAGKVLGGTHRLNNMIHHRGYFEDYADLIHPVDAEKVLSAYEENSKITEGKFQTVFAEAFVEGARSLGFDDFGFTNLTYDKRFRFTHAGLLTENCDVVTNAFTTKILFAPDNAIKAIGIEFEKENKLHSVYGTRIILSAGTVGTAKIMLLSGIGPKEDLENIGIEVRANLSVGQNLQDHISTGINLILLNQTSGMSMADLIQPRNIFNYFLRKNERNVFSFSGCDAIGFVNVNETQTRPDLSFMLIPNSINSDYGVHLRKLFSFKNKIWEENFQKIETDAISILPVLLKPKSKGFVKLRSKNFRDPPIIDPNYLAEDDDVKMLVSGISIIQHLLDTPEFQKFGAEINPKKFTYCEHLEFNTFSYWECYIRHMTLTVFHPTSRFLIFYFTTSLLLNYSTHF